MDQPVGQQEGCISEQEQFFCHKTNPIPTRLQSVIRHVHVPNLYDLTPALTMLSISALAVSKAFCKSCDQAKTEFFLRRGLKGAMRSDFAKAKETCSTSPNQLLIPVMSVGRGKLEIADRVSSLGRTPSLVMRKPTYSISWWPQTNFFEFWTTPCCEV